MAVCCREGVKGTKRHTEVKTDTTRNQGYTLGEAGLLLCGVGAPGHSLQNISEALKRQKAFLTVKRSKEKVKNLVSVNQGGNSPCISLVTPVYSRLLLPHTNAFL